MATAQFAVFWRWKFVGVV